MRQRVKEWLEEHSLSVVHQDCVVAVMLKIMDGKCKMPAEEKAVMQVLYDLVKHRKGKLLGEDFHQLISQARDHNDDGMRLVIYEKRVLVETMISRPVMKSFKAMIRQQGLLTVEA